MRHSLTLCIAAGLASLTSGSVLVASPSTARAERAAADQAKLDKALAGKTPGKPVNCIALNRVNGTTYIGDSTILYRVNAKLTYRNDPVGGCPGLRNGAGLVTRTPSTRLCSGDIATVRDFVTGIETGACSMAEFVPYRK
ncbi:hypothetical protein [Sphingomonas flavalba]|uniref:hypothetical protein n=1 Tax=Sphingomonas flavalba TaxID=2559804 RepID=UPI00109DED0A|nr:hypothetical protein [Sphingomonas flavalba]